MADGLISPEIFKLVKMVTLLWYFSKKTGHLKLAKSAFCYLEVHYWK